MTGEILKEKRKILAEQLRELADDVEDGDAIPTSVGIETENEYQHGEIFHYFSFLWRGEYIDGEEFQVEIPQQEVSSDEMEELGF